MFRQMRLLFVILSALAALFMIPAMSFAASPRGDEQTTREYLAFTARYDDSEESMTGGLTLDIYDDGYYNGNYTKPDGTQISVSGKSAHDGNFDITFYNSDGKVIIKGWGYCEDYLCKGTFKSYNDNEEETASGIWSAKRIDDPDAVETLDYTAKVTSGPHKGTYVTGALILYKEDWKGTFLSPEGWTGDLQAKKSEDGKSLDLTFYGDHDTKIVAVGKHINNPDNDQVHGYHGWFKHNDDRGHWQAYYFHF
jgi:hypothetical protein